MGKVSTAMRHRVVILHEQGHSQAEISRRTGLSRCGIQALLKKHKETGQEEDKRRSGRPRKLTKGDEKYLKINSLRARKKFSTAIAADFAYSTGRQVHPCLQYKELSSATIYTAELQNESHY